jgi:antitoxin MazE7
MALSYGYMSTETATIRVPRQTRDRLAARARARGVSISSLLSEFALRAERADAFRSEREATLADAANSEVLAEEREWDAVLGDGLL